MRRVVGGAPCICPLLCPEWTPAMAQAAPFHHLHDKTQAGLEAHWYVSNLANSRKVSSLFFVRRRRRRRPIPILAVIRNPQLFQQLRRHFPRVLALGIAAATQKPSAAAGADDHWLAALVAVDVRRNIRRHAVARQGGTSHHLGNQCLRVCRTLLERWNQRLHVLELFPRELGHGFNPPALGKARAPQPRAALAIAQHHISAAFLAFDRRGNWLGLRWQRIAGLVEIDDRLAI